MQGQRLKSLSVCIAEYNRTFQQKVIPKRYLFSTPGHSKSLERIGDKDLTGTAKIHTKICEVLRDG